MLEGYERHAGGDRPGWMVEMDRFYRIQFAGGDPITLWLNVPSHWVEPPTAVVRRYWAGIVEEVRAAPAGARVFVCSHSGPMRALAAAAVGHDPGEPHNVEDVRIRVADDFEHATLTYRGRAVELDIPTAVTPSWAVS
jgi:broad specificity phosphatase PhoE